MSTLEPDTESIVVSPEQRRRILEIMEEKGKAFSQQAIAIRIGMHYDTLRKKLRGGSKINMFELRRIAEALHLSVERLLKIDTIDDERRLNQLLVSYDDLYSALEIAQKLSNIAVGATERVNALNELGRTYYLLQRYDDAHSIWLEAYEVSKKVNDKNDKSHLHQQVLSNLLISFTVRNEFSNAHAILEEVEIAFHDDPVKLGATQYTRAKIEEQAGDLHKATEFAKQSLAFYEQTGQPRRIGRAKVTLAHYEYLNGNYNDAVILLRHATELLEPYKPLWYTAVKEYAKVLVKIKGFQMAKEIITAVLNCPDFSKPKFIDLAGKLRILLSICTDDLTEAETVLENTQVGKKVRFLAYRHLKQYCLQHGDTESLMKYAIIEEQLEINKTSVIDEEDF